MSIKDMWKSNAITLILLIVLNLALFSLGNTPWLVLGLICLAAGMFLSYRQGMGGDQDERQGIHCFGNNRRKL